tara:strand:+ start:29492 stop:29962 length:471 start_codon:yes stop_codon:yes gene_type:complete
MKVKMSKHGSILLEKIIENVAFINFVAPVFVIQELLNSNQKGLRASIVNVGEIGHKMKFWYPSEWELEGKNKTMPSDSARLNGEMKRAYQSCVWGFHSLIRQGVPKNQAMSVLPVGIYVNCELSINCGVLDHINLDNLNHPFTMSYISNMKDLISE